MTTPRQQPTEAEAIAIANIALLGQQLATTTAGSKRTIAAAKNITMTTIAIASVMNSRLMAAPGAALFEFSLSLGARVCRGVRDHVVAAAARRTSAHRNTHLSMSLKRTGFADWDAIPRGALGSGVRVR